MRTLIAAALLLATAGTVLASDAPDPQVKRHLEAKDTPYEIDADNDFKITVNTGEGRTQLVYVLSETQSTGHLAVRELWSVGYQAPDQETIPADVANRLLSNSHRMKLGGWVKQGPGYAIFVIKIPAESSADELDTAIDTVAETADEMEEELTGDKDQF